MNATGDQSPPETSHVSTANGLHSNQLNLNLNRPSTDDELIKAIELSMNEERSRNLLIQQEEEELRRIIELSLMEK